MVLRICGWVALLLIQCVGGRFSRDCDCAFLKNRIARFEEAALHSKPCDCDCGNVDEPVLLGLRVDDYESVVGYETTGSYGIPGTVTVQPHVEVRIRIFGINLLKVQTVLLTQSEAECLDTSLVTPSREFNPFDPESFGFSVVFPQDGVIYYVCFAWSVPGSLPSNQSIPADETVHQGNKEFQRVAVYSKSKVYYLPLPLQICMLCVLLVLSGLFSGLNLGLMTLNRTELQIIRKCGDKTERKFAEKIYPVRKRGNYLLCSLLLGNVLVNSAISILFDDLTTGFIALAVSSFGIVVFGEIVPQAICSRYGLAVGAYTVVLTKFFMLLTAPISWPISKILDKCLGEEVGQVYNKDRLLELIRLSKEQEGELRNCQEVQIVTGALELSRKTVADVMTNIKDVFMLSAEMILTPSVVNEIVKSGYTRIPVYEGDNRNLIVGILNVKDLALLDPEDQLPLNSICKFYQHPVRFVMEDTPLSLMLEEFKKGHYHLALVQRIVDDGVNDPVYQVVGLITLEDIIEEIIQAEIMDEFDVMRESRRKVRRRSVFLSEPTNQMLYPELETFATSPQMVLAAYQFLSTTFEAFSAEFISRGVFDRLMNQYVLHVHAPDQYEPMKLLYQKDLPSDAFLLILEGRATVVVGRDDMIFDAGPFHHFGYDVLKTVSSSSELSQWICTAMETDVFPSQEALINASVFVPDYSLRISTDVVFLRLTASQYLNAVRATVLERGHGSHPNRGSQRQMNSMPNVHMANRNSFCGPLSKSPSLSNSSSRENVSPKSAVSPTSVSSPELEAHKVSQYPSRGSPSSQIKMNSFTSRQQHY
uniref:CNNM transmembrane domain-containing protein n=1 Tax=Trichuris muris TaxID=70415 RepID=A0A5S6R090_TRIMR